MKLPLPFRSQKTSHALRATEDRTERLLAEGLRLLSQFCAKMADYVEAERLARSGYRNQGKFLERQESPNTSTSKALDSKK